MANNKKKKLTPTQQEYQELAQRIEPPRPVLKNCLHAFITGGVLCLIGQAIQEMFVHWAGFTEKTAADPTVAVMILISVILTSFGVYDKLAQWSGAGTAVPVTGFANAMASAAIEHRSEGIVLGVGGQMFKIAGPVIVFGTVAAFVVGILTWIIQGGGGS
ncbi:stage V sporulation protein AC [Paenibacillus macquariensis]|uniref:Stage V sporulation protein AC n=1 Tax=Paenibacillus macquariensis TaxID=948756 RepID=A0ABY1K985_9BACL|nr:stage V sporulation protein AC [Paenibacillus macquariensis]MEC0091559.1 stage V sporulation protein AC [Paenibacillus macquariensis]OAB26686.1 stage V sporulation protein AC [Paenibacillus macquariensis subsp. macquariensis]SIR44638.1 stage V sporulation protein AC [Paenibacillus macquariensis]